MLCLLVWGTVNWAYQARLSGKDAEISLLQRQRDDYKDKLGGASPDEAKARIDKLETQIKSLIPRKLTDDQRSRLAALLARMPGIVAMVSDMAVFDARALAGDFTIAFNGAGWQTQASAILGPSNPPLRGIGLIVPDPGLLTPKQALMVECLTAIGVEFDLQRGNLMLPGPGGIPGMPSAPSSPDAGIIITQKIL